MDNVTAGRSVVDSSVSWVSDVLKQHVDAVCQKNLAKMIWSATISRDIHRRTCFLHAEAVLKMESFVVTLKTVTGQELHWKTPEVMSRIFVSVYFICLFSYI